MHVVVFLFLIKFYCFSIQVSELCMIFVMYVVGSRHVHVCVCVSRAKSGAVIATQYVEQRRQL